MGVYESKKEQVLNKCPRGKEYFCDGTPNKTIPGWEKRKNIGKCPHREKGMCTYLE